MSSSSNTAWVAPTRRSRIAHIKHAGSPPSRRIRASASSRVISVGIGDPTIGGAGLFRNPRNRRRGC